MTDEEIKQLAEKTKKEKYCPKFYIGEDDCSNCPITYEGYPCSDDYVLPFVDGFKVAENKSAALKEAAQNAYNAWMGGTMNDVRDAMKDLGEVLGYKD